MKVQLIVDFGDRGLSALLVTAKGELLPCSQAVQEVSTRYLSSEILFDPKPMAHPDFFWDEVSAALVNTTPSNFFQRARRLGLRRPWDLPFAADALRLSSPITVLSSPTALVDPLVQEELPGVGILLLNALLDPIFSFLNQGNFASKDIDVFLVIQSHAGWKARLALHKVFRRRGFRRVTLLTREIAASLALLEEAPLESVVWDVSGDDLHLHRVAVTGTGSSLQIRTQAARTARGLGWTHWVQQIAAALASKGQVPDPWRSWVPALNLALKGLVTGTMENLDLPVSPTLRLSHDLIRVALDDEQCERLAKDLRERLELQLAALDAWGLPVIQLGAICGVDPLRRLFLSVMAAEEPPAVLQMPILERTTRSVAAGLLWMREAPFRRLATLPGGSLRLNSLHGEALELLPASQFPSPGEESVLRHRFHFAGNLNERSLFLVNLLWGSDTSPEGNASLCAFPLEVSPSAQGEEGGLSLTIYLRLSPSGRRLTGTVHADLEGEVTAGSSWVRKGFAVDLAPFVAGEESVL